MSRLGKIVVAVLAVVLPSLLYSARHESWIEVRSPNFVVVSNAGEKQARKAALQFEQIRAVFRQSIKVASSHPSPAVTILAMKDESSMRELLPEFWVKGHTHPAGIFVSRFNLCFAAVELDAHWSNPYETFYHEYYHAITTPYFPDLPVWLSEGLAEYYGSTQIEDKFVMLGKNDPDLVRQLWDATFIPLNLLFKVDRSSPYYNEANKTSLFYAESWALTHYLMIGDRGIHKPLLLAYLDALNHGKTPDDAVAAFGDLKQLQTNLESYIRQPALFYSKLPTPAIDDNELKIRSLSEAEADAYRGGFAVLRNKGEDAKPLLAQALQLDPNDALAYQYLAITQFLEGQRGRALESVSKAISLDPGNSFTRYMRAFLATTGSGIQSGDAQVEEDLRQAIASRPEFAPPYGLLAVYLATVDRNLPEALSLAQKAVSFEPGSSGYQLALAQVLARMDKLDEADLAAARARAWAREPEEKANARSVTAYLQEVREDEGQMEDSTSGQPEDSKIEKTQGSVSSGPGSPSDSNSAAGLPGAATPSVTTGKGATPAATVQMQTSINLLSDALGFDFTPYFKALVDTTRKNLAATVVQVPITRQRSVSVEFAILKDGKIAGLNIASSSGDAALDQATRDGIVASSPLPALPEKFKGQYLRLHLGLVYSPDNSH